MTAPGNVVEATAERIYDAIYEDEDARSCADISEGACTNVPSNFFLNAVSLSLTKLGDAVVNAKTTLPWLLSALGAPAWIASVLVPVRESGSMLPQLAIASRIRELPVRKWSYVLGAVGQGLCVFGIVGCALALTGLWAGLAVLGLVVAFSLARGLCSVASKDVLGKTVPKRRRGRVTGLAASIAGLGTLVFAGWLWWRGQESDYLWLLGLGAVFWLVAAMVYSRIEEEPGATEGGANGLGEAIERFSLLRDDDDFRRFVIVRSLLVGTALTAPFLVMLARELADSSLAYFLAAQGAASMVSGHFWGAFADRSSRQLMMVAGGCAGVLGLCVVAVERWLPGIASTDWFLPLAFFVLACLHDGVRLGRKTYVIDLGGGNKRTDYVAVSNTVLGVVLLFAGGVAALAQSLATWVAIMMFSMMAFVALQQARKLPEVQQ